MNEFPTIRLIIADTFIVLGAVLAIVADRWLANMCFSIGAAFLGSAAYTIGKLVRRRSITRDGTLHE